MLIPPKPGSGFQRALSEYAASLPSDTEASSSSSTPPQIHDFWVGHEEDSKDEDLARKRVWRVGSEQVQRLRDIVKRYEATHNFHNFTVGREYTDRSNNRYMKKIEVGTVHFIS